MRSWNLKPGTPLPLLLGADMRFGATDYCNDQTWELAIGNGEPPALALMTTYGLRARMLRIFPHFVEGDASIIDPATFTSPLHIKHFYPNLIGVIFSPLPGINVEIEYWVPDSQVIAARTKISNASAKQRTIRIEWATTLNPLPGGQRMIPADVGMTHILSGRTEGVAPVLYLSGGAQHGSGPFTSLILDLELSPKESCFTTWALASLGDVSSSYELARNIMVRNWEAEVARIAHINSNLIEVHTGDQNLDLAFTLAQNRALGLLFQGTNKLTNPSYVATRLPDMGFSYRGDGTDYSHLWNGQTPLETWFLINLLLPTYPEIAQGLLFNFLNTQTPEGFVDWKPGLAGQRSQILASPLLTSLAWRIYQTTEDKAFLVQIYPSLLAFVQHWFEAAYDRDADGIPEWNHPMQTGLDEHPLFSTWQSWSPGIDITSVESPDLCASLYQECMILVQIARLVEREEAIPSLQALADHLKTAVEAAWDESSGCYHYWDRESHYSSKQELLGTQRGAGEFIIHRLFEQPARLQMEIRSSDEATRPLQIYIHGSAPSGGHRVEKIDSEEMRWNMGRCRITSERIYSALEHIEFQGLVDGDQVSISTVGHTSRDITSLLPLWAGITSPERARSLVKRTITNPKIFWGTFGLRTCADSHPKDPEAELHCKNVYIPYNCLIGEGLVRYGNYKKASELVIRIMKAVVSSMQQEGTFRRVYNSETGQGNGERNALSGLPPLGLFLEVLGVRILNPQRVIISGLNPYPWPVTIKYQGLTVMRQKHKTMVIFPNGQNVTIKNSKTQIVGLE
ncbi:MAG: hypothetical protein A2032_05350 [Chloroflexi bacterium RBG_19FT_COMBO_49_13]|nr:MAG: hypothetical protein A2032_05350 [Chloroflexi bacterium RBG_19FT_COMBO_49_13]